MLVSVFTVFSAAQSGTMLAQNAPPKAAEQKVVLTVRGMT